MTNIDQLKHNGMVEAITRQIGAVRNEVTGRLWEDFMQGRYFVGLEAKISKAERLLADMRELLRALQELEPGKHR